MPKKARKHKSVAKKARRTHEAHGGEDKFSEHPHMGHKKEKRKGRRKSKRKSKRKAARRAKRSKKR